MKVPMVFISVLIAVGVSSKADAFWVKEAEVRTKLCSKDALKKQDVQLNLNSVCNSRILNYQPPGERFVYGTSENGKTCYVECAY